MFFKQFYLGCLAQASYLVGSDGEAAVVDPRRDVEEYLKEAAANDLKIRWVIETHLHADFVSGHNELAERTGATIVFGAKAGAKVPHRAVSDGEEIALGKVVLRFLETPGHTPESITVLVVDPAAGGRVRLALTGDTLFIGDVGRPDLAGGAGYTPQQMAEMLYDSLHEKILRLADEVEVYPAHGAGSLCGKNISKETSSTIGEQRRTNYALQPMARDQFVRLVTADQPEVPSYFPMDVEMNRQGAGRLDARSAVPALDPAAFAARAAEGALVVDVRGAAAFGAGHVPGSFNIALKGQFASWAGTLLDAKRPLLVVAEDDQEANEAALRLSRVGLENVAGTLAGGIAAWDAAGRALARLPQIAVDELKRRLGETANLQVIDVRRPGEFAGGHVPGATLRPLDRLETSLEGLDPARPTAVICAGGYRSSAAASVLERKGFRDLTNVVGGTAAWTAAGYPLQQPD